MNSIDQARQFADAVMIIEADSGGQVLATCPAKYIRADQKALEILMYDLENFTWGTKGLAKIPPPASEAFLRFERLPVGTEIGLGASGGRIVDGLWLHPEFREGRWKSEHIFEQVENILGGRQPRIELECLDRK